MTTVCHFTLPTVPNVLAHGRAWPGTPWEVVPGPDPLVSVAADPESIRPAVGLAVLIRLVQWHLDDMAHDLPNGRTTAEQRHELAGCLEALGDAVRHLNV